MSQNSDTIVDLPVDGNTPTLAEMQIVNQLFKQNQSVFNQIVTGTTDVLLLGLIFIIFSLPQFDNLLMKFVPMLSTSPYVLLVAKTAFFMLVYFIIKNLHLVRKQK